MMEMSPPAIEILVKQFEGCKLKAYRCPASTTTVSYTHPTPPTTPRV